MGRGSGVISPNVDSLPTELHHRRPEDSTASDEMHFCGLIHTHTRRVHTLGLAFDEGIFYIITLPTQWYTPLYVTIATISHLTIGAEHALCRAVEGHTHTHTQCLIMQEVRFPATTFFPKMCETDELV